VTRVLAIVAARDEADRVADTVAGLRSLGSMGEVVVVVDGSRDGTAEVAAAAGARVLVRDRGVGKGGALEAAVELSPPADVYLFADGDLGTSAEHLGPVLRAVLDGDADLAVAILPLPPRGGFGLVKRAARGLIRAISGFDAAEPLSGQRAIRREALEGCRPLAGGFGVEVGMTADAARLGFRVVEVPAALEHRFTGRDLAGFRHRARQGRDVVRAALPRLLRVR
jgi:hypothetical protein